MTESPDLVGLDREELAAAVEAAGVPAAQRRMRVDGAASLAVDDPLMERIPTPGSIVAERKLDAVGVTEWTLSNGIRVLVKPTDFKADEILFSASSLGGTSLAEDRDYIAGVTASVLASQAAKLGREVIWLHTFGERFTEGRPPGEPRLPAGTSRLFALLRRHFTLAVLRSAPSSTTRPSARSSTARTSPDAARQGAGAPPVCSMCATS